jgi:hypothetical protein
MLKVLKVIFLPFFKYFCCRPRVVPIKLSQHFEKTTNFMFKSKLQNMSKMLKGQVESVKAVQNCSRLKKQTEINFLLKLKKTDFLLTKVLDVFNLF